MILPDAPHPSYLAQPEQFNHLLLAFALHGGRSPASDGTAQLRATASWKGKNDEL